MRTATTRAALLLLTALLPLRAPAAEDPYAEPRRQMVADIEADVRDTSYFAASCICLAFDRFGGKIPRIYGPTCWEPASAPSASWPPSSCSTP